MKNPNHKFKDNPAYDFTLMFIGLFFAFYVLLACFIFLNLILAVVYNERRAAWKSGRSRSGRGHGVGVAPDAIVDRHAIEQAQSRHATQVLGLDQE